MKKTSLLLTMLLSFSLLAGCQNLGVGSSSSTSNTSSSINLVTYKINVKAINGKELRDVTVEVYKDNSLVKSFTTDYYGKVEATLEKGEYTVKLTNLPKGMYFEDSFTLKENEENDLVCSANLIEGDIPNNVSYNSGDLMHDFSFFNVENKKVKLSKVLEGKKGIILNFWGTTCIPCKEEFPLFQQLYNEYSTDIEIVALSVEDSVNSVANFKLDNEYTFTMGIDLMKSIFKSFSTYFGSPASYSIPGTVFIDKYGFVNRIHKSSYPTYELLQGDCLELINKY